MNAFAQYEADLPQRFRTRGKPRAGTKYAGGILIGSPLEQKIEEKRKLSRKYRMWKRQQVKEVLASEPRLGGFLRYLRTVTADTGKELIEAVQSCAWLIAAPLPVRLFALRMIDARCNRINQQLGNDILDDPLPPESAIYFEAKAMLHRGGQA